MRGATSAAPSSPASAPPQGRVRSAIGWSYLLTAGRVGSSIVVTFLLAKLLGPSEFGLVAMATVFITVAQTVIQQGLVAAIVQRDQLTSQHLDAAFVVLLLTGLGGSLLTAAASPLWALVNRAPELTVVCLALSPLVLIQGLGIVPEAVLRRELQFRAIAIRTLLAAVLSGVVGVALALAGAGIWALVGQQLVNAVVSLVVLWVVCPWRPSRRPRLGAIRELWAFSAHAANAGLGSLISSRADIIFTGIFFGPVATGIYRLAARLPDMLVDVTVRSIQQVALPSLSRLQQDRAAFTAHLVQLQHLGAVAGLPVLGVLAATAEPLVTFLGPQWAGTEIPLRLLCLFGAVNVYGVLLGPALQAIGRPAKLAAILWSRGVLGVATLAAVGTLMTSDDAVAQATAVALAGIAIQLVVNAAAVWVTVHRAVGASVARFLAPTGPAALAALAAVVVPVAADRLGLATGPPLLDLLLVGGSASLIAATVLGGTDRRLRRLVVVRLRAVRRTQPAQEVTTPRVPAE
ncbi:lipopolysaccharide biosynthesis protein [Micromonospora polyrhachis]|uniref:PST family polysaccharide transporter n=1 Tax=Micromonospora polyrhachis TaxID=1282883 RepID=A0A7W7WQU1_9ACTN|nr:lipopolysaccharide biosynthesis protein [Micromonospora polyrhachis]MBB4960365.1 PST family polysaccharide transporter [Micromonospora polyrhachis]